MDPSAPDPTCPRYGRGPLPRYRYLPGRSPHPRRDPRGHSFGQSETRVERIDASAWAQSETWRHGVDLHNFGFAWEAHEAFEALWRGSGGGGPRPGKQADFFQGLIQICAARIKRELGEEPSARALLERALHRLAGVPSPFLGVDLRSYERAIVAYFQGDRATAPLLVLDLGGSSEGPPSAPEEPRFG